MAKHEFGIMPEKPKEKEFYEDYEPERYNCISIDDGRIESLMPELETITCYSHTLQRPIKSLEYCGITLIPPDSLAEFLSVLKQYDTEDCNLLIRLLEKAKDKNQFVIHYGL